MPNPLLIVQNAGCGETPVPEDALLKIGEELGIHDVQGGKPKQGFVRAIVPAGVNVDYAIADQSGEARPLAIRPKTYDETIYVIDMEGTELLIGQAAAKRAWKRADDAGLNDN